MNRSTTYRAVCLSAAWLGSLAALVGCGADDIGVTSVDLALRPAADLHAPAGLDAEALASASGSVVADVFADEGTIEVTGLPALPEGLSYDVELTVVAHEREGLGTGEPVAQGGHTHGALTDQDAHAGGDGHDHAGEPIALGSLRALSAAGQWFLGFDSAALQGRPMGGLRGCKVWLVGHIEPGAGAAHDDGHAPDRVLVLSGAVGAEASAASASDPSGGHGAGHTHGV